MPRARLPQLHSIADGSFEPKRKNAITLREDENLEDSFKPLQIGGKNTALELSSDSLRISGNLLADRIKGDVNINNGNLNIDEGFRLRFDSESEMAGFQSGNSSIHVEDDEMHFTVGGVTLLKLKERVGLGIQDDDKITTFGSHLSIDEGFKLYFEGMDSDSYLTRTTSDVFEFYGDNVKLLSIKDDGNVVVEAGKLILENGEYISNATDDRLIFSTALNVEMANIDSTGINIPAAKYLSFDGGGHTNVRESADDVLTFTVGNIHVFEMREFSSAAFAGVNQGNKIVFDMDTILSTYITESSDDVLDIYVGGDKMLSLDETVDSGVTSLVGTFKIAEQADASADTAGYGQLWVKTATPNELYFTTDAGDDIQLTSGTSAAGGGASVLNDLSDVSYSSGDLTILSLDKILAGSLEIETDSTDIVMDSFRDFNVDAGRYVSLDSDSAIWYLKSDGTTRAYFRQSSLNLSEGSAAHSDAAGFGQLWVKDDTPNNLYFTNDAGNDVQITNGSSIVQKFSFDFGYYNANLASTNTFYSNTHIDDFSVSSSINTGITDYNDTEHSDIWRVTRYAKRIPFSGSITKVITHVESTGASADSDIEVGVWIASISDLSLDTQLASTTNVAIDNLAKIDFDFDTASRLMFKETTSFNATALTQGDFLFVTLRRTSGTDGSSFNCHTTIVMDVS